MSRGTSKVGRPAGRPTPSLEELVAVMRASVNAVIIGRQVFA